MAVKRKAGKQVYSRKEKNENKKNNVASYQSDHYCLSLSLSLSLKHPHPHIHTQAHKNTLFSIVLSLSLALSQIHTHKHTHTHTHTSYGIEHSSITLWRKCVALWQDGWWTMMDLFPWVFVLLSFTSRCKFHHHFITSFCTSRFRLKLC